MDKLLAIAITITAIVVAIVLTVDPLNIIK